jgi:hypothetical protein
MIDIRLFRLEVRSGPLVLVALGGAGLFTLEKVEVIDYRANADG